MVSNPPSALTRTSTLSKKAKLFLKMFMVLFGPLFFLVLLEGIGFIWESKLAEGPYAWELVASRRIKIERHFFSGSPYVLMKPGSHYEWQGIQVDINSRGLRGKETTHEKPVGTFRILNLGDSVAMGWGVREQDTYSDQLEMLLNDLGQTDVQYEVINAGVPGWSPRSELAYLQAEGLMYDPDMIILDLTIVNDIYIKNPSQNNDRPVFDWLRDHTYSWSFLSIKYQEMKARSQGKDRIPLMDPPSDPINYFPLSADDEYWDQLISYLSKIHEIAAERNIPLVLVLFPIEHQVVDPAFPRLPQTILSEQANSGVYVIDLLSDYEEACNNKPDGKCKLEDHYLFADLWMHPSVLGHQIAAENIFTLIQQQTLISQ